MQRIYPSGHPGESAIRRRAVKPFTPVWKHDAIAILAGLLLAWIVMRFHGLFFGVPALP